MCCDFWFPGYSISGGFGGRRLLGYREFGCLCKFGFWLVVFWGLADLWVVVGVSVMRGDSVVW